MKKDFKAPTIETKALSTENSIMDAGILGSTEGENTSKLTTWNDQETKEAFNAWKGFGSN